MDAHIFCKNGKYPLTIRRVLVPAFCHYFHLSRLRVTNASTSNLGHLLLSKILGPLFESRLMFNQRFLTLPGKILLEANLKLKVKKVLLFQINEFVKKKRKVQVEEGENRFGTECLSTEIKFIPTQDQLMLWTGP